VIDLNSGRVVQLGLRSPHNIRKIKRDYWVFDSGNWTINIYDQSWSLKGKIPTRGYCRGADISEDVGVFCAGISETRRRYLHFIQGEKQAPNMVQFFSIDTQELISEVVLSHIEQVNSVHVTSKDVALALLKLNLS
jgi:hypothetical protein